MGLPNLSGKLAGRSSAHNDVTDPNTESNVKNARRCLLLAVGSAGCTPAAASAAGPRLKTLAAHEPRYLGFFEK